MNNSPCKLFISFLSPIFSDRVYFTIKDNLLMSFLPFLVVFISSFLVIFILTLTAVVIYSSENYFLLSKLNLIPLIAYINEIARVTILLWVLEVHGIESVTNT